MVVWCKHCAKEVSGIRPDEKEPSFSSYRLFKLPWSSRQLCKEVFSMDNYEELVDPSTFIPRFTNDRPETKWIICGAAIYIAALSHDIADMGEETITYILNEFANTEAASLTWLLRVDIKMLFFFKISSGSSLKFLLLSVSQRKVKLQMNQTIFLTSMVILWNQRTRLPHPQLSKLVPECLRARDSSTKIF
uniref:Uncharacterized protein n=1 Tax=Brassica oleracea TaxID=3712 RepID=A0A3P6BMM9_BRAOL|nr:unnamed protein product [Brassica oleracea]